MNSRDRESNKPNVSKSRTSILQIETKFEFQSLNFKVWISKFAVQSLKFAKRHHLLGCFCVYHFWWNHSRASYGRRTMASSSFFSNFKKLQQCLHLTPPQIKKQLLSSYYLVRHQWEASSHSDLLSENVCTHPNLNLHTFIFSAFFKFEHHIALVAHIIVWAKRGTVWRFLGMFRLNL